MSRKLNTFAAVITQPLNTHNFVVTIPGANTSEIVVSSTSFPSEKLRMVKLYYQGEEIRYPTIPENSGTWDITIPESDGGVIRRELENLKGSMYDQMSGIMDSSKWKNITVTARDLNDQPVFQCVLHGAWISGRDDVSLDNSDPTQAWKWKYTFHFQYIEDIDLNYTGSPNPLD